MAKQRIEELKVQECQRQIDLLMQKQEQDRNQVDNAHSTEYQEFNQQWDHRLQEKEQEHMNLIQMLQEKHTKEIEENRALLDQRIPVAYKASSELLNLKKIQDQLARQREYAEAHKVQQKIVELEREEQEKYVQVRNKKIVAQETALI